MSPMTPLWALVPVKDFSRAKSRLSRVLAPAQRAALAQRLCEHVLGTLRRCSGIAGVLVLSDSPAVLALARDRGASAEAEVPGPPRPLGLVVDEGLRHLERRGAQAALVLMSDLPLLSVDDLEHVVGLLRDHDWVLAPDLCQRNTNALLLRLRDRPPTAFGSGDSFAGHSELARRAGLRLAVHCSDGLGFDLDVPEDHARLQRLGPGGLWQPEAEAGVVGQLGVAAEGGVGVGDLVQRRDLVSPVGIVAQDAVAGVALRG